MKTYPEETLPAATQVFLEPQSFDDAFAIFAVAQAIVDNPEAVKMATKQVLKEFLDDNVLYVELRSTPRGSGDRMTKKQYVESILQAIDEAKDEMEARYLVSFDRRKPVSDAEENLALVEEFKDKYPGLIVGVELSGDARQGDARDFKPVMKKATEMGLKVSMHFAEVPNDDEIRDFLFDANWRPDRVGHSTCLHPSCAGGSQEFWAQFKSLNVPSEMCLTSNVNCKSVESYDGHHVKHFYKENVPFSICTDDKGAFSCSLTQEFERVVQLLQLSEQETYELTVKTIDYIFAGQETKDKLKGMFHQTKET